MAKGGAERQYDREKCITEILLRVASGEYIEHICKDKHLPTERTYRTWLYQDERYAPAVSRARAAQASAIAAEGRRLLDETPPTLADGRIDPGWVQLQFRRSQYRQWLAERQDRKNWASGPAADDIKALLAPIFRVDSGGNKIDEGS